MEEIFLVELIGYETNYPMFFTATEEQAKTVVKKYKDILDKIRNKEKSEEYITFIEGVDKEYEAAANTTTDITVLELLIDNNKKAQKCTKDLEKELIELKDKLQKLKGGDDDYFSNQMIKKEEKINQWFKENLTEEEYNTELHKMYDCNNVGYSKIKKYSE